MLRRFFISLMALICISMASLNPLLARDFEGGYAVYGAGGDSCRDYLKAMQKGGKELDYFVDWSVGYLTAFNVIMPETYNILGETDFPTVQRWLERHCRQYRNQLYIQAVIKLTEVLYPARYKASLKESATAPSLKDVSRASQQ